MAVFNSECFVFWNLWCSVQLFDTVGLMTGNSSDL